MKYKIKQSKLLLVLTFFALSLGSSSNAFSVAADVYPCPTENIECRYNCYEPCFDDPQDCFNNTLDRLEDRLSCLQDCTFEFQECLLDNRGFGSGGKEDLLKYESPDALLNPTGPSDSL